MADDYRAEIIGPPGDDVVRATFTGATPEAIAEQIAAWAERPALDTRTPAEREAARQDARRRWEAERRRPVGIPYARAEWVEGVGTVRICPVCGVVIPEPTDAEGEALANPYGDHYAAAHAARED